MSKVDESPKNRITYYSIRQFHYYREHGWSGGESGSSVITEICSEDKCKKPSLPCGRYCLAHITLAPEQRLYASCAAVFAVGSRCNYPLLPLKDQLPLCTEHAWKRVRDL